MTGYEVVTDDLTAHASHLDGLADRLDTALSAAQTAAMSDDAYGLLCAFVPPIINPMEEKALAAVKSSGEAVRTTADNVRTAKDSYSEREEAVGTPFRNYLE